MPRRYHQVSPHTSALNVLLTFATLLCLWNIWTAPPDDGYDNGTTNVRVTGGGGGSGGEMQNTRRGLSSNSATATAVASPSSSQATEYISVLNGSKHQILPIQTMSDGRKAIDISSPIRIRADTQEDHITHPGSTAAPTKTIDQNTPDGTSFQRNVGTDHFFAHTAPTDMSTRTSHGIEYPIQSASAPQASRRKKRKTPKDRYVDDYQQYVVQPSDTLSEKSAVSSSPTRTSILQGKKYGSSISNNHDMVAFSQTAAAIGTAASNIQNQASNAKFLYLVAISLSLVGGVIMAKRALDRFQRWEEESQADSLEYDIAYTTTMSEIGYGSSYGSFASVWTDDLDKFDI